MHQKNSSKNHIIIGDFNININDYNSISNDFINNLLEKGFLPSFTKTTRPSNNYTDEGSCIDNIFIKTDSINTKAFKLMVRITDHYPLFLVLKNKKLFPKNIDTKENTYYYNYKKLINI